MQTSDAINEVAAALAAAQAEMKPALKDANNPHFKSKYADLASVFDAIRGPLAKHNLAVLQDIGSENGAATVKTRLVHKSGQWIEFGPFSIPADRQNAHGYGSAVTYVRRFALASALGVSADDDDGNAAVQTAPAKQEPAPAKNAPGISEAKGWVRDHIRDLNGCGSSDDLMEVITDAKPRYVKICGVYPNLWTGPDGTGLRGEAQKMATAFECRPAFDKFIKEVEAAAVALQQPMAAEWSRWQFS